MVAAARGTGAGYAATMRFVVIGSFGAALMLIGIALVYQAAGTLNLAQLAEVAPGTLDGTLGLAAFVFILVGAGNQERGITAPHHSPEFDIDESVLPRGAERGDVSPFRPKMKRTDARR